MPEYKLFFKVFGKGFQTKVIARNKLEALEQLQKLIATNTACDEMYELPTEPKQEESFLEALERIKRTSPKP